MPKIKYARKRKQLPESDSESKSNCSSESEEESESEIEEVTPPKSKGKRKVAASSVKSKRAPKVSKPSKASKSTPAVATEIKKKKKKYRQKTLFPESSDEDESSHNLHVKLICPSKTYGGESALFTDEIYGNKLPEDAKGKLFKYRYHDYLPEQKTFTLKYVDQAIELRGVDWIDFPGNPEDVYMKGITVKQMKTGHQLFLKALGRIKEKKIEKDAAKMGTIKAIQDLTGEEQEEVSFDDINEEADENGGRSQTILDFIFELDDDSTEIIKQDVSARRKWILKGTTHFFWQYTQKNIKRYDSGCFNKWLIKIKANKSLTYGLNDSAIVQRAVHVLNLRQNSKTVPLPADGLSVYTEEEDLPHHIRESFVVCDSSVGVNFYSNVFVKELLRGLNDRHNPTYHKKTLRIIRCIVDTLTAEIYLMISEGYLNFNNSFVSSTSDFWWDKVKHQSYGACILNFMAKRYKFRNGRSVFVSDSTRKTIPRVCNSMLMFQYYS